MLLGQRPLLDLESVPVVGELACARVRSLALEGEPRAALADLLVAGLVLLDARADLGGEFVQPGQLPPKRLDPLRRRRDLDTASRQLAHRPRLLCLRPLDRPSERRHARLVGVLGLSAEGDARLEPLEQAVRLRPLRGDLRELGRERSQVPLQAFVLAVRA